MKATWMRTLLALSILAVGAATQLSCTVNDYCLNCATGDGGNGDGGGSDDDGGLDDAGVDDAGCIPDGEELCDGKDNDCNGLVDDGVLPGVGELCANQNGVCAGGVQQCVNGTLRCDKMPGPEVCDGLDNNCNGTADEGDPGGGGKCGTEQGECVAGTFRCNTQTGTVECVDQIDTSMNPELCNAKDDDCDGNFDENVVFNPSTCGPPTDTGECVFGTLVCQGGGPNCVGAVYPHDEDCNNLDDDCDGNIDEIFNKQIDPRNCGTCGNECQPTARTCINTNNNMNGVTCTLDSQCPGGTCAVNSQPRCASGACGFTCNAGFHNLDMQAANGCEYRCFATGAEVCDGIDNDCDGDVDEGLTPPPICLSGGECGATAPVAQCNGAGGWECMYPSTVQFPETLCDGLDNDCDANTDENQPNLGNACDDGRQGVCRGTGAFICNAADLNGPAVCNITMPGQTNPDAQESCDDKDNDCDGLIDEGASSGNLIGQEWVDIGAGKQMMKYEASKPDAGPTSVGARNTIACSKQGVQPWTNVKYGQALAACQAIGATLCGESTWHRACSNVTSNTYPISVSGTGTLIEAEDYSGIAHATSGGVTRAWVPDYTPGFSSISAMVASPNTGADVTQANAASQSPRLDYRVDFTTASANYHVWVRMFSISNNDNSVRVGITNLTPPQTPTSVVSTTSNNTWQWRDAGTFSVPATGIRTVSIFMAEDGLKIDQIYIVNGSGTPPSTINTKGGKWAYASNQNTYQPTTCNGDDLDTNSMITGDQDDILSAGSLASCRSTIGTSVFDMSGNVKEWTLARKPGENPIRGGASNNTGDGISCPLNFTLANNDFFFPNVGFRCCRPSP